jgi:thioredoxin 1
MLTIKYFTAKWCGPCKAFSPIVDKVILETGANIQKIDVDLLKETAAEYYISSIPTLVFEVDGKAIHRQSGAMSYHQLLNMINNYRMT